MSADKKLATIYVDGPFAPSVFNPLVSESPMYDPDNSDGPADLLPALKMAADELERLRKIEAAAERVVGVVDEFNVAVRPDELGIAVSSLRLALGARRRRRG